MKWDELSIGYLDAHMEVISLKLRTNFRNLRRREIAIFLDGDRVAEWSPFPEYDDKIAGRWLTFALEQFLSFEKSGELGTVASNTIVPAMPVSEIANWLLRFPASQSVKVKVAAKPESVGADRARLKEIRNIVGPEPRFRLDANGAWNVEEAYSAISELAEFGLDYVEQPVSTLNEFAALRANLGSSKVRLAADELIRGTQSVTRLAASGIEVAVLKPSHLGGIIPTLGIVDDCVAEGLEVVISSSLESSVGLGGVVRAAVTTEEKTGRRIHHGLGTGILFADEIVFNPIVPREHGVSAGIPKIDHKKLAKYRVPVERRHWWSKRLDRCFSFLSSQQEQ